MSTKQDKKLVSQIIKGFGPVIDLRSNPGAIIEILRKFSVAGEPTDGGQPCGGTPPPPPPSSSGGGSGGQPCGGTPNPPDPPPSSRIADTITNREVLAAVTKLSRDLSAVKSSITSLQSAQKQIATSVKQVAKTR